MYAGYTICTSREHIVYGAFCGSTVLCFRSIVPLLACEISVKILTTELLRKGLLHGMGN